VGRLSRKVEDFLDHSGHFFNEMGTSKTIKKLDVLLDSNHNFLSFSAIVMPAKILPNIVDTLDRLHVVREFETSFREATRLEFKLRPLPDDPAALFVNPDENAVCALICNTAGGCQLCHQTQQCIRRRFEKSARPQQLHCLAGLTIVAVPVVVSGTPVAILHTNRIRVREPKPQDVAQLARQMEEWGCNISPDELEKELRRVPTVPLKQVGAAVRLLRIYADYIGELAGRCLLAEKNGPRSVISRAVEFVHTHFHQRIHLRDAARQTGLSPFYFCKLFKKTTGMTFKSYLVRTRIEQAKDMLLNPAARIGQVALATGFGCVTHFNRAFKRYTGLTPSEHRDAVLKDSSPPSVLSEPASRNQPFCTDSDGFGYRQTWSEQTDHKMSEVLPQA